MSFKRFFHIYQCEHVEPVLAQTDKKKHSKLPSRMQNLRHSTGDRNTIFFRNFDIQNRQFFFEIIHHR